MNDFPLGVKDFPLGVKDFPPAKNGFALAGNRFLYFGNDSGSCGTGRVKSFAFLTDDSCLSLDAKGPHSRPSVKLLHRTAGDEASDDIDQRKGVETCSKIRPEDKK